MGTRAGDGEEEEGREDCRGRATQRRTFY